MKLISYILLFLLSFCKINTVAQPIKNQVYKHQIKTVLCHKSGWPLSYPLISLNYDSELELSFDDLASDPKDFYYSIVHCNKNWEPSGLMDVEFVEGINETPILDYEFSFNANIDYVHYNVKFPNEDVRMLISGNFIIKVYEDNDPENIVLTQRFMVTENRVSILPQVKYTLNADFRDSKQEVDFTIKHPNFEIRNPLEEIKVDIIQNERTDNAIINLKPQFIRNYELDYNYNREVLFEGGNEFRWLDLRSTRTKASRIRDITFHEPYYHFDLFADETFAGQSYYFKNDFNGKYVIELQERGDSILEADYVFVHFTLPRNEPFVGGELHILGGLTNWNFTEDSKMTYNFNLKQYEATLLLKQGFYNYQYAFKPTNSNKASINLIEGSYSKAENDYLILVYYRGLGDYYDRLIGASRTNSVKP